MNDVFISYAREDLEAARALATMMKSEGYSVWWDRKIEPGQMFSRVIEEALDAAACVLVLWSRASVDSHWVNAEAAEAARRGTLIPILLEDVNLPLEFRRIHAASLLGSPPEWDAQALAELLGAVSKRVAGATREPAPKAASEKVPQPAGALSRPDNLVATGWRTPAHWVTATLVVTLTIATSVPWIAWVLDVDAPLLSPLWVLAIYLGPVVGLVGYMNRSRVMMLVGWLHPGAMALFGGPEGALLGWLDELDDDMAFFGSLTLIAMGVAVPMVMALIRSGKSSILHEVSADSVRRTSLIHIAALLIMCAILAWLTFLHFGSVPLLLGALRCVGLILVASGVMLAYFGSRTGQRPMVIAALAALVAVALAIGGNISFKIIDKTGDTLPGVSVVAEDLDQAVISNVEGRGKLSFLPVGSYQFVVGMDGFETVQTRFVAWLFVGPRRHVTLNLPSVDESTPETQPEGIPAASLVGMLFALVLFFLSWRKRASAQTATGARMAG